MRDYLTQEEKSLVKLHGKDIPEWERNYQTCINIKSLESSYWADLIDSARKKIREIKAGLYQGDRK